MNRLLIVARRAGAAAVTAVAVAGLLAAATPSAAAPSTVPPVADHSSTGVTADALPTVQIDGVVWSQAIVGNTVYAGGEFANARPAGAAPGTQLTPRSNLLAYNLTTGALITSFDPDVNGTIKSVVASPDGSRIYIGGSFTSVDGTARYRIAALDATTGQLITSFFPVVNATVNSLSVTSTTVYAGGIFGASNSTARTRLAAFSADTGSLLAWSPSADDTVDAVQLTPDGKNLIVGGAFQHVNGSDALGLASVDASTGVMVPFAANQVVKDYGSQGAILSLSTDGTSIFGTGYDYGSPSNFEGTFSADPTTGTLNWLEDCHGDTYGSYATGGQVYVVSHEHYCANIGGFPDTTPRTRYARTSAFTTKATGTVAANGQLGGGYGDFAGQPSPSLVNWFPDLTAGTYTKQYQAAWTVTGNDRYVVEGGEFPSVNGTPQQGLVRFAVPSLAPNKRGPMDTSSATTPTVRAASATSVTVSWPANWDQDNDLLTYRVMRSGSSTPVRTTTAVSQFWNRPTLTVTDTGLKPGTAYTYDIVAADPDGNTVQTSGATVSTPALSATAVTVSPATPVTGQRLSVRTAIGTVAPGAAPATGTVTVAVDGTAVAPSTLSRATATTSLAGLRAGRHTITVRYGGDAGHAASSVSRTVTVAAGRTTARVTSSKRHASRHTLVHFRASVRATAPATGRPTGRVVFYVDGHRRATRTLHSGAATWSARLPRGRHRVKIRYIATSSYRGSTSKTVTQRER